MMIQQDLAEIYEFQSKCLAGKCLTGRERVERGMIIMFGLVAAMGRVMRWSSPAQVSRCQPVQNNEQTKNANWREI